jgi:imidazolonepropionase-like amidohydrolase
MNRFVTFAATAGSCLFGLACIAQDAPSGLVISDVTVVSPERAAPLQHAYVRIVAGRIEAVSERRLRGAEVIDGTGRYLVPGFIDSHVHLAVPPGWPAGMTAEQAAAHPDIVAAALAQEPRSFLFFGFTTVVDLIGSAERTARWNAYDLRPDAYFCGGAAMIDDHIQLILVPYFSYDQTNRIDPAELTPETAVASIAANGAICVKTFYDEAIPGFPTPTVEAAHVLVAAAHQRGLPVFIHVNRKRAQAFAVAAGVDVIVHGMWRNTDEEAALDDEAREILAAVVRDDIGYQPTTQVIVGLLDVLRDDYLARPELADAYPAALIDWYASEEGGWRAERMRGAPFDLETSLGETINRAAEVTRILSEADAHLLFGSDTPSDLIYANPPGLNGRLELDNLIAGGVSEEKLFRILTIDNARAIGLDDEIGTVEPGKAANLLLLSANPLEGVAAYDTIGTVFLHGRPIPRETLSARNTPKD